MSEEERHSLEMDILHRSLPVKSLGEVNVLRKALEFSAALKTIQAMSNPAFQGTALIEALLRMDDAPTNGAEEV